MQTRRVTKTEMIKILMYLPNASVNSNSAHPQKIGHSTALASHFMSYLDVFNKKLTVFADKFVIKEATML